MEHGGKGARPHRGAQLPTAVGQEGHQPLVKVLPQGHSGKAGDAQDLAGPPRDTAPAAESGGGHLPRKRPEALGREDADAGAKVLLVADGL